MRAETWQPWIACVAILWAFSACSKSANNEQASTVAPSAPAAKQAETAAQPPQTPKADDLEPDPQAVPIAADFEAKAEAEINKDNYLKELDQIEKDIERR